MSVRRQLDMVGVAREVQEYLDTLGYEHQVLAVSMVPVCQLCQIPRFISIGYPDCTHLVRVVAAPVYLDTDGGTAEASHIHGIILPVLQNPDGSLHPIESAEEVCGWGPALRDVCVLRAVQWLGREGATVVDIHPHWRQWPSVDLWAEQYGEDLSSGQ